MIRVNKASHEEKRTSGQFTWATAALLMGAMLVGAPAPSWSQVTPTAGKKLDKKAKRIPSGDLHKKKKQTESAPKKKEIGVSCHKNSECKTDICGYWEPNAKACLPKNNSQDLDDLCSTNKHCRGSYFCANHRCDKLRELGEPCDGNATCQSGYCDEGLGSGGTKKCVPPAGTGKPGQYCSQEAHCKSKLCLATQCQAPQPSGGACRYNESCQSGHCDTTTMTGSQALDQGINQAADLRYKCIPRAGTGKTGEYCAKNGHCQSRTCSHHKCQPMKNLGQSCPGGNGQCHSGYCDAGPGSGGTNKCVPAAGKGSAGDYCSQNAHCKTKICSGHKCSAKKSLGQSCPQGNSQCASGYCDAGMGSGGTNKCVPAAGTGRPGDYCSQNGHCRPGKSCRNNKCR